MRRQRSGPAWRATVGSAALLCACGGAGASPGAVVRDSAGITIVENDAAHPIWTEATAWRLAAEPAVSIGTVDGDSAYLIHRAIHSRRLRDGTLAVVSSGTTDARLYTADGRHVRTVGRSGDGPGEFRSPWAVFEGPADSLVVVDLYRSVLLYDRDGAYGRQFPVGGHDAGGGEVPEDQFADGSLLMLSYDRGEAEVPYGGWLRAALLHRGLDGTPPTRIRYIDEQVTNEGGPRRLFGPRADVAAADTTVWYSRGDAIALEESARDGTLLRIARLPLPPVPATEEERKRYLEELAAANPGTPPAVFEQLFGAAVEDETLPAHGPLVADAGGHVWVQAYRMFTAPGPAAWYVFRADGHYLGTVEMPGTLTVHHIGTDFVLGVERDDLGVERLRMYDLVKPEGT